jgi:hypothetical protein
MISNNPVLESMTGFEGLSEKATSIRNAELILGDAGEYQVAEETLQEAIKGYEKAIGIEHQYTLKGQYGPTPLSWAAREATRP